MESGAPSREVELMIGKPQAISRTSVKGVWAGLQSILTNSTNMPWMTDADAGSHTGTDSMMGSGSGMPWSLVIALALFYGGLGLFSSIASIAEGWMGSGSGVRLLL